MGIRRPSFRSELSKPGLLRLFRREFGQLHDAVLGRKFALTDYLMAALAMFVLKAPSLLQFDKAARREGTVKRNLRRLFGLRQVPCDSAIRKRLDLVDPETLQKPMQAIFRACQRGKVLEGMRWFGDRYLLAIDGTGTYSSTKVCCKKCCVRDRRNGTREYYHQTVMAALVHPNVPGGLPIGLEGVRKTDGATKNDCEHNASKRLISRLKAAHPRLPVVVLADGLASNGPYVKTVKDAGWSFVLGAKPGDHGPLFEHLEISPETRKKTVHEKRVAHEFTWLRNAPLNRSHPDCLVNIVHYREIHDDGRIQVFSWVTDLDIAEDNLMEIMRAGRSRWRIENEVFNVMKNNGCHLEHNFGHGKEHLCDVFTVLMTFAHAVDEIEKLCCRVYREVKERAGSRKHCNGLVRWSVEFLEFTGWDHLYDFLRGKEHVRSAEKDVRGAAYPDTS